MFYKLNMCLTINILLISFSFLVFQKYEVIGNEFEWSAEFPDFEEVDAASYFKDVSKTIDSEALKLDNKIELFYYHFATKNKINDNDFNRPGFKIKDISKVLPQNFNSLFEFDDMRLDVEMPKLEGTDDLNGACDGNGNEWIDEVLSNAKQDLAQRKTVPDFNSGNVKLWNIYVWGFDSLRRVDDACFEIDEKGNPTVRAIFQVFIVRGSASGSYREAIKIFGGEIASKTFSFDVDIIIPYVKLRLGLNADLSARVVNITEFEFDAFDDPKFHMKLGGVWKLFTGLANRLADEFGSRELKPKAKIMIKESIAKELTKFNKFDLIPHFD